MEWNGQYHGEEGCTRLEMCNPLMRGEYHLLRVPSQRSKLANYLSSGRIRQSQQTIAFQVVEAYQVLELACLRVARLVHRPSPRHCRLSPAIDGRRPPSPAATRNLSHSRTSTVTSPLTDAPASAQYALVTTTSRTAVAFTTAATPSSAAINQLTDAGVFFRPFRFHICGPKHLNQFGR
ncbi:type IV secretion system protein virB4 [Striga asiatica]|uniref:Type IV secretion system protein virB4 n=1 Tax=Striga asiatica TaxID=4170 RepID=A0A5A7PK52_STRAF|nr:type IV secretion system protein virB4 [Striga asiatica]